jgi:hypothetical protein
MIYRGPSFLEVTHRNTEKKRRLADKREGVMSGRGAKSYDGGKAWSSINHSMLSGH